jgi:hypothetical protein
MAEARPQVEQNGDGDDDDHESGPEESKLCLYLLVHSSKKN